MIIVIARYAAALYSPPRPVPSSYLFLNIAINSPRIPLTCPRTPAPRSSGPFRHQILHSTTPNLPLKPPLLRLSGLYILGLVFLRNSITAPSAYSSRVLYAGSVLEPRLPIYLSASKHRKYLTPICQYPSCQ